MPSITDYSLQRSDVGNKPVPACWHIVSLFLQEGVYMQFTAVMNVEQAMAYNELCLVCILTVCVFPQRSFLAHFLNNMPAWFCHEQAG
jgi:hypothetical protein